MLMSMPSLSHPKFSLSWWIGKNYVTLTFQSTGLRGLVSAHSIMVFYIYKWFSPKCLKIHIYFKWINAYWLCTLCWALCLHMRTKRWIRSSRRSAQWRRRAHKQMFTIYHAKCHAARVQNASEEKRWPIIWGIHIILKDCLQD